MSNPETTKLLDCDVRWTGFRNESGEQFTLTHLPTGISVQSEWIGQDQSLYKAKLKLLNELQEKIDARI